MLVVPPNVTQRLELNYSRPITPDIGNIEVKAKFDGRKRLQLTFRVEVRDPQGLLLARARAFHSIIDNSVDPRPNYVHG